MWGIYLWRRKRDSNPRYAINVYALSRGAPSATRPFLHKLVYRYLLFNLSRARSRVAAKLSLLVSSRSTYSRPKCRCILSATRPFLHKLVYRYLLFNLSRARSRVAAKLSLLVSSRSTYSRPKCRCILSATRPFLHKLIYRYLLFNLKSRPVARCFESR